MSSFDDLWPMSPPKFIHVTGPRGVGKTLFTLTTGADPKRTIVLDGEASAQSYNQQLGLGAYHNLIPETAEIYGDDCSDIQYFTYVQSILESLEPGKFDVLVLDNILRFENGLVAYVKENHQKYGYTKGQMSGMPALIWGPIKVLYQNLVVSWCSKVKMAIVTTPIGEVWAHAKPTGVKAPKGKDVLEWLTDLRIWLQFQQGKRQPVGLVLKDRVSKLTVLPSGEVEVVPVLPRRICPCTWAKIREYMANPADPNHPRPEEQLTDEEWRILNGFLPKDKLLQLEVAKLELQAEILAQRESKEEEPTLPAQAVPAKPTNVAELVAKAIAELGKNVNDILRVAEVASIAEITDVSDVWDKLKEESE